MWTALNHSQPGILAITIGDRSGKTFSKKLWERVKDWGSKWYMTDGYCVYANFIDPFKHLIMKKTKMTSPITPRYVVLLNAAAGGSSGGCIERAQNR